MKEFTKIDVEYNAVQPYNKISPYTNLTLVIQYSSVL